MSIVSQSYTHSWISVAVSNGIGYGAILGMVAFLHKSNSCTISQENVVMAHLFMALLGYIMALFIWKAYHFEYLTRTLFFHQLMQQSVRLDRCSCLENAPISGHLQQAP
jgi:hypothetical protein